MVTTAPWEVPLPTVVGSMLWQFSEELLSVTPSFTGHDDLQFWKEFSKRSFNTVLQSNTKGYIYKHLSLQFANAKFMTSATGSLKYTLRVCLHMNLSVLKFNVH